MEAESHNWSHFLANLWYVSRIYMLLRDEPNVELKRQSVRRYMWCFRPLSASTTSEVKIILPMLSGKTFVWDVWFHSQIVCCKIWLPYLLLISFTKQKKHFSKLCLKLIIPIKLFKNRAHRKWPMDINRCRTFDTVFRLEYQYLPQ